MKEFAVLASMVALFVALIYFMLWAGQSHCHEKEAYNPVWCHK